MISQKIRNVSGWVFSGKYKKVFAWKNFEIGVFKRKIFFNLSAIKFRFTEYKKKIIEKI